MDSSNVTQQDQAIHEDGSEGEGDLDQALAPLAEVVESPTRFLLFLAVTVGTVAIDQLSKMLAVAQLTPGESPTLLGGLINFSIIRNPGAAFSLASGMTWVLALVTVVISFVIVHVARRMSSLPWAIGLGLVLGGAVGNLVDRVFRAPGFPSGHIVDFISLFGPYGQHLPVFNLADLAIISGALTLVITTLRGRNIDGQPFGATPDTPAHASH